MNVEGSGRSLIEGNIPAIAKSDWGISQKTCHDSRFPDRDLNSEPPNTKQEC
jgi:hypothetical protein